MSHRHTTTKSPQERLDASKGSALYEIGARHLRLATYVILAYGAYAIPGSFPLDEAHEWRWGWVLRVAARNFALMWLLYGGWHWALYGWGRTGVAAGLSHRVPADKKFNPKDQYADGGTQLRRELLFVHLGFAMSSAYECVMLHLWASGRVPMLADFWSRPYWSLFHMFVVAYWRDGHFFFAHRVLHPWFKNRWWRKRGFDPGQHLYKHVHALHHKSHNPGPFSGLSMHPVEHLLYYSCTLLCLVFTLHPVHFLYNKFHADFSPAPGHDGYDSAEGGGSYFHYLHHAHFEVNYGTPMVPFDKLFGTHSDGSEFAKSGAKPGDAKAHAQ